MSQPRRPISSRTRWLLIGWMVVVLAWHSYLIVDSPGPLWFSAIGIAIPLVGMAGIEIEYRRSRT